MHAIPGAVDPTLHRGEASGAERRGPARKRVLIPAVAVCAGEAEYRCILRDISSSGAKIGIARGHRLPARFKLVTGGRPRGYPVRLVWQRGNFAGLALDVPGSA